MLSRILKTTGLLCFTAFLAFGTTVTFQTAAGSLVGGLPVNASATFVTSTGQLEITLTNLFADPTNAPQLISGLTFDLSNPDVAVANIGFNGGTGQEVTVASHAGTLGSTVNAGWILIDANGATAGGQTICVICPSSPSAAPTHTIIGPGSPALTYGNAQGSIDGNPGHNPFLYQTVTFTLTNVNITDQTSISNVIFRFNTTWDSSTSPGVPQENIPPETPEPATFSLAAGGLLLLGSRALKNRRKRRD